MPGLQRLRDEGRSEGIEREIGSIQYQVCNSFVMKEGGKEEREKAAFARSVTVL